jgi:hypothetical protein
LASLALLSPNQVSQYLHALPPFSLLLTYLLALCSAGVDKITFIGSPEVGKMVMRDAVENLTPVVLELGGKDAAVLCDDCDYDQVHL